MPKNKSSVMYFLYRCLVWSSHQTGQEQTTADSDNIRKKKIIDAPLP